MSEATLTGPRMLGGARIALLACGLLLTACQADAQSGPRIANADSARLAGVDALFAAYDRLDRPGYAVGIVQHGRVVYARGFGSANLDFGLPITRTSAFNVASLAKQFTAVGTRAAISDSAVTWSD